MVYEPSLKLKHMNLLALELPVDLPWKPSGPLSDVDKVFWVAETAAKGLLNADNPFPRSIESTV